MSEETPPQRNPYSPAAAPQPEKEEEIIQVTLPDDYQLTPPPKRDDTPVSLSVFLARLTGNRLTPNQAAGVTLVIVLTLIGLTLYSQSQMLGSSTPLLPITEQPVR